MNLQILFLSKGKDLKSIYSLIVSLLMTQCCFAGVLYSNGDQFADFGTHYSKSDTVPGGGSLLGQVMADNFTLSSDSTIDSVRWWGAWNFFKPAIDDFTINIYGSDNGLPDASNLIASRVVGNVVETATGLSRSSNPSFPMALFEFQADIVPLNLQANQEYWISIYDTAGSNTSQYFLWREIEAAWITGSGAAAGSTTLGASWGGRPVEFAFQLEGSSAVVPEPASALIFLAMSGQLLALRRRSQSEHRLMGRTNA